MNQHQPMRPKTPDSRDVLFAASLLIVAMLSGLYIDGSRPDTIEPSMWWHWLLLALPPALVAFRRVRPVEAVVAATVTQAAIWVSGLPDVLLPVIVILYTAAADGGKLGFRTAVGATAALSTVTAIGVALAEDVTAYQVPLVALTGGTAIVLGVSSARQREEAAGLAAVSARTELLAERRQAEAINDERAHIGRELHDSVGHALSIIAVRAEAADRVAASKPDEARIAVGEIAGAARRALADTRRVLAGLREASTAELAPPPDLDATRNLITRLVANGVDIEMDEQGCDVHSPSPAVAGGTYRIVQESITNAVNHGGPNTRIRLSLQCSAARIDISVTNTTGSAGSEPVEGRPGRSEGSGLAGMRERASILGGTFEAGPRPDGTFTVTASLPNQRPDGGARR